MRFSDHWVVVPIAGDLHCGALLKIDVLPHLPTERTHAPVELTRGVHERIATAEQCAMLLECVFFDAASDGTCD
jgi:hypothetical protein